jgi:hypothetical protein
MSFNQVKSTDDENKYENTGWEDQISDDFFEEKHSDKANRNSGDL